MGTSTTPNRSATFMKWGAVVAAVVGVILLASAMPIREMIDALSGWIDSLGVLGPIVYGVIYVVAVVLMAPGSALTIAAGAIFGLWVGTVVVSLASTTGAALAFLIARYLARSTVARQLGRSKRFAAIDRAIGQSGWKIVALLRLSPAVPFNVQNYLYGLTAIGFWPAVLASWVAMLPGTFLYVYIGYAGRESVEAAAGARSAGWGQLALLIVGVIATAVVTVLVTRLAMRAVRRQTDIADSDAQEQTAVEDEQVEPIVKRGSFVGALVYVAIALLLLGGGITARVYARAVSEVVLSVLPASQAAPPMPEAPTENDAQAVYDQLLHEHVDADGWVDYASFQHDAEKLDTYLAYLAHADLDSMTRDEQLATLINAYNAFTIKLILDHADGDTFPSIKDIPANKRWKQQRWWLAGKLVSLDQIEHEMIRPVFDEPRIHFALVCAAYSCPKLRNEAYTPGSLEQQLADQTAYVHSHDRWLRVDGDTVYLTKLYDWYGSDFETDGRTVRDFVSAQSEAAADAFARGADIDWIDYSWELNSRDHAP